MARTRTDPPRWFGPTLFGAMLLAVAGLTGLVAWLYVSPNETVKVGTRTFVIPPSALAELTPDPVQLVRIRPPGKAFEIVHDGRAVGRRDRTGVPHIFSINDGEAPDVRYGRKGRYLVLCRRSTSADGACGTWIDHGGAYWSVLFPEGRRSEAETFAREAALLLRKYDTQVRGVLP